MTEPNNRSERVQSYILSLSSNIPEYLDKLSESAREDNVPIIRPAMMDYMRTMLALHKPMTILEIGCAIGFSALLMREYAPDNCRIITIENYEPRISQAKENFEKFDGSNQITLLEGDAVEILSQMTLGRENVPEHGFDMIFMDAAKGQYINMYDDVKRLLRKGGLLLSDNILQEGDILESRYAVTRRDRTIHSRMRDYLWTITHDEALTTTIIPMADGIAMSVKIN